FLGKVRRSVLNSWPIVQLHTHMRFTHACRALTTTVSVALMTFSSFGADATPNAEAAWQRECGATHDQRMQWWREARFGMFIHWGVYSVPAGVWKGEQSKHIGEWLMLDYKIPVAEYAELTKQFNPVKFDAERIVKIAKDAGMKYIV